MGLVFFPVLGVLNSPCTKKLRQLLTVNKILTPKRSLLKECKKDNSTLPLSLMMFEPSQADNMLEQWILCLVDSPVKTSRLQAKEQVLKRVQEVDSGLRCLKSSAKYDQPSSSWKTCQQLLGGGFQQFSQDWLKQGIIAGGYLYEQVMWEPDTVENGGSVWLTPSTIQIQPKEGRYEKRKAYRESIGRHWVPGCLEEQAAMWPTPSTQEIEHPNMIINKSGNRRESKEGVVPYSIGLADKVKMWPTTVGRDCAGGSPNSKTHIHDVEKGLLRGVVYGEKTPQTARLSPLWVEWLMGFPKGWTDLNAWVTQWFPSRQD